MSESTEPPKRSRLRRAALVIGVSLTLLVAGSAVGVLVLLDRLNGNITTVDLGSALGSNRPAPAERAGSAVNVLLMGSDTREGQGAGYGEFGGPGRSDTTILLHIAADRRSAIAVSIPRDLWVDLPTCTTESGSTVGGYPSKFNAAFAIGGPACTIKAVEELTDVFVDHYVVVDFTGFKRVVDALGGVPVCMEEAVDDPKSGLELPAGVSVVKGEQALAFVRARKTLADGSDTARIARQQEFLSSMVRTATSRSLLTNPVRLVDFLDATTSSLTTDPGLGSVQRLSSFGREVKAISPEDVTFLTAPSRSRGDGNVELVPAESDRLFAALRDDTGWPPPPPGPTLFGGRALTVAPQDIKVRVLNGTAVPGAASRAADQLRDVGFTVIEVSSADRDDVVRSMIRASNRGTSDGALRTLGASTDVSLWVRRGTVDSTLTVVVGEDWSAPREVLLETDVTPTPPSTTAPSTTARPTTSGGSRPPTAEPTAGPTTDPTANSGAPTASPRTSQRPGEARTAADRICSS